MTGHEKCVRIDTVGNAVLFEVLAERRKYVIYANGKVEGFGESAIVFNHYPVLRAKEIQEFQRLQQSNAASQCGAEPEL